MTTGETGANTILQRFGCDSSGKVVSVDDSGNSGATFAAYDYLRNAHIDDANPIDSAVRTLYKLQ